MPTVVLVGTLDTKGQEYAYLADRIREHGVDVVLVDAGIVGEPLDDARRDAARRSLRPSARTSQALAAAGDRGVAVETMARGAAEIVKRLRAEGKLDAIGGLGGSGGSSLATYAMRQLPIGVPEADGLDRRLGRHEPVRRLGRRDDDVLRRRHRRRQPDLGADHDERRRGARRHGEGDGAAAR